MRWASTCRSVLVQESVQRPHRRGDQRVDRRDRPDFGRVGRARGERLAALDQPQAAEVIIAQMLKLAPDNVIGVRDRALICLGFAGAMRRSELCALEVSDLVEVPDGLWVTIRRSKTDQTGEGVELPIPRGSKLRPVDCVNAWLAVSGITSGPLFRAVAVGGGIGDEALKPDGAARIIKRYARRVGLDPAIYSGHSLRSGYLTSAAESGASLLRMADQSRHKSLEVLRGYVRRTDMWKVHSGALFL
jgi:integrase